MRNRQMKVLAASAALVFLVALLPLTALAVEGEGSSNEMEDHFYEDVKYIGLLLQNNLDLLEIYVFSAGTKVFIPEIPEEYDEDIPEWRR